MVVGSVLIYVMSSDLDSMYFDRTGKNHNGNPTNSKEEVVSPDVGDEEMWEKLK